MFNLNLITALTALKSTQPRVIKSTQNEIQTPTSTVITVKNTVVQSRINSQQEKVRSSYLNSYNIIAESERTKGFVPITWDNQSSDEFAEKYADKV